MSILYVCGAMLCVTRCYLTMYMHISTNAHYTHAYTTCAGLGEFVHESLKTELWLGGVFVRPLVATAAVNLQNRGQICHSVLHFLHNKTCKDAHTDMPAHHWRLDVDVSSPTASSGGTNVSMWASVTKKHIGDRWLVGRLSDEYGAGAEGHTWKADVLLCMEALRCLCDRDGDDKLVSVFCTLVRIYVVVYVYV